MRQSELHVHQAVRILELNDPPHPVRAIEKARRSLAKQWHPDHASPDQRSVHERHMIDINRAADLLIARAEELGGELTALHVRMSEEAALQRAREAAERAEAAAAATAVRTGRAPRRARAPERSVVHSYARSRTHPEWGVGTVANLFATGDGDDMRRWAQIDFDGRDTRTMRYENLEFVDFTRPDSGVERSKRFLTAAQEARKAGDHVLAVKRLIYARNADATPEVLEQLAVEQRLCGDLTAAARTARTWARAEPIAGAPYRLLETLYREMGAEDLASEAGLEAAMRDGERRLNGRAATGKNKRGGSGARRRKGREAA
jgi:hypothetical protein